MVESSPEVAEAWVDCIVVTFEAPPVPRRTNGSAIASLVLGILGIVGPLPVIGPILALVFGYQARNDIDRGGGVEEGRGLAVAGIVLGWVGVGMTVLFILLIVLVFAAFGSHSSTAVHIGQQLIVRVRQ